MYNRDWNQNYLDFAEPDGFAEDNEQYFCDKFDEKETEIKDKLKKLILQDKKSFDLIIKLLSHGLDTDLPEANQLAIKLDLDELDFIVIDNDFDRFSKICPIPEPDYGDF